VLSTHFLCCRYTWFFPYISAKLTTLRRRLNDRAWRLVFRAPYKFAFIIQYITCMAEQLRLSLYYFVIDLHLFGYVLCEVPRSLIPGASYSNNLSAALSFKCLAVSFKILLSIPMCTCMQHAKYAWPSVLVIYLV